MKYLIAHDLGTSGTKSSLFAETGELVASVVHEYEAEFNGREATQNPDLLLDATIEGTRQLAQKVNPADIPAMSFSAQMSACLLVDRNGKALHDTFIWADTRAEDEARQVGDKLGYDYIYQLTANRASANYSLYKLMWIKKHHPDLYHAAYRMLQAKEYVIYHLTGRMITEHSDASGTGAYDIHNACWSEELIEAAEVRRDLFPVILNSVDPVGTLRPAMAARMGLKPETLVVAGGGDGPCAAVGAGCVQNDRFYLTYGTSAWVSGTTEAVFRDPDQALFTFRHIIPGKLAPFGSTQSAGNSYAYIRKLFAENNVPYREYDQMIERVPAGSDGLIFLPYLIGERSPIWDPQASAAFIGLHASHRKAHMVRAVLEGVALNLEWILSYYRREKKIDRMIITGGGAASPVCRQILADVLNVELQTTKNTRESTAIAAAIMAGIGAGVFKDFDVLERFVELGEVTYPEKENVALYEARKEIFREAYLALKHTMARLDQQR